MGSEHYCLRWNNHQSNLLGVFSQLLQDESLVDVTLACSEGTSIRAHKVVLSACSSYFQTLFLDHPARHPIVILKDVRFAELRTLIEFMYKGEVNVEYCQLSALLKTAESLKVKGLAEMTNQSSVLRDSDREPERLRTTHSHTTSSSTSSSLTSTAAAAAAAAAAIGITTKTFESLSELSSITKNRCLETETCSPSPTRLQSSPTPLALYQRKNNRDHTHSSSVSSLAEQQLSNNSNNNNNNSVNSSSNNNINMNNNNNNNNNNDDCNMNADERHSNNNNSEDEDDNDVKMKNEMGLNMIIAPNSQNSTIINSTSLITDLRPSSRGGLGERERGSPRSQRDRNERTLGSGGIPSPLSEPIPGPSGMGPVQQVPLSLKKEIDWDRSEDKSSGDSSLDFRHPHDSESTDAHGVGGISGSGIGPPHVDQGGPIYPCVYCGATFPHQSKLTRHILSHSLETLKYRETAHMIHPSHLALLQQQHELSQQHNQQTTIVQSPSQSQQLSSSHFPLRTVPPMEPLEPPDGASPMDIDYATAAAAAAAAASAASGNSTTNEQGSVVLCKFCGKSFPDVSSLITHLPVHTGDRPFKCEFCGKAFKLRHHMKDHCRVHTGERPFRCGMCGKTFSRSTILKAHEKTHYPKYVRKFLSPSPVDSKDESPQ